jgi:hypothetical protein
LWSNDFIDIFHDVVKRSSNFVFREIAKWLEISTKIYCKRIDNIYSSFTRINQFLQYSKVDTSHQSCSSERTRNHPQVQRKIRKNMNTIAHPKSINRPQIHHESIHVSHLNRTDGGRSIDMLLNRLSSVNGSLKFPNLKSRFWDSGEYQEASQRFKQDIVTIHGIGNLQKSSIRQSLKFYVISPHELEHNFSVR